MQAKVLEIRIRQMELMVIVRQAQQVCPVFPGHRFFFCSLRVYVFPACVCVRVCACVVCVFTLFIAPFCVKVLALRGKEASLLQQKQQLEQRMETLQSRIRVMEATLQCVFVCALCISLVVIYFVVFGAQHFGLSLPVEPTLLHQQPHQFQL